MVDTVRIFRFAKVAALMARGHSPADVSRSESGSLCVLFNRSSSFDADVTRYNSKSLEANAHIMQAVRNALVDMENGDLPLSVTTLTRAAERAVSGN